MNIITLTRLTLCNETVFSSFLKRSRHAVLFLLLTVSVSVYAQQTIKVKVDPSSSKVVVFMVNQMKAGISIDWGDGNATDYSTNEKGLNTVSGHQVGDEIIITAGNKLKTFVCADNNLTSLNVTGAPYLQSLYCQNNKLTELSLTKCKELKDINCSNNSLTKLSLTTSANPNLETLNISGNTLGNVSGNASSTTFTAAMTNLQYADISNNGKIKIVKVNSNNILDYLDCSNNNVTSCTLPTTEPKVTTLVLENNNLTTLDDASLASIQQLYADNNAIGQILLKDAKNLSEISAADNKLTLVTLPSRKMRVVNYPGNMLYFNSFPKTLYKPEYMTLTPQNPFPIEGLTAYNGYQYIVLSPGYSERANADYYVDMGSLLLDFNGQNKTALSFVSFDNPDEPVELVRVTRSGAEGDFINYNSGKVSFLTPHYKVCAKLTHSTTYTEDLGYVFYSQPFAVSKEYADDYIAGIGNVTTSDTNDLNVLVENGQVTISASKNTHLNIYTTDGKCSWNGNVGKTPITLRLPKGIYILNGKKVIL